MSSLAIALAVMVSVVAFALLGARLRGVLPVEHLSSDSKDVIKLGTGLIATLVALILGLFAPRNVTVLAVIVLCALSVSTAMFIILELERPFSGLVELSRQPFQDTLWYLDQ